jgi:prepilin-type processing-associated H-X9-DG protein
MSIGAFSGQVVWGFADGHVASMRRERVMDPTWDVTTTGAANNVGKKNLLHYSEEYK